MDGLSIGAAFAISTLQGVSIAIAVLCEELPHELGDLAILLHSGLSLKRAILYNSLSGLTCFVGFAVGVFLGELTSASTWIFAVASGMFIYISFVNILPEMISAVEAAGKSSTRSAVVVLGIQTFGVMVGIFLMYILARFSGQIQISWIDLRYLKEISLLFTGVLLFPYLIAPYRLSSCSSIEF